MTPVANSTSERGQISIFFSASIIVLISIIAFVINIGLFVKAKINLQNATDAAAFAGASVQARQLTKIAYLNWEMRNIYKEWMYKYYVVGNLNIADVENPAGAGTMSFRLQTDRDAISGASTADPFNFPAVCIHLANSKTNICKRYAIPGLPEFGSSNLPGAEEASRAFMDVLISSKVNDCIDRTRLNMLVNLTWAFNVLVNQDLDNILVRQGPAILANRQGAWPQAVELAMRMRNLERAVNREAESSGICENPGSALASCTKNIEAIVQDKKLGSERVTKAFYSGLRNLGNEVDSEMKDSFTLTEIPPRPVESQGLRASASYLLIPERAQYPKQYLDLHLMMVNYATFYAAMIPRASSSQSGACDVSKVAIPIPGYPLGFYKNPELLTYYAVRGEAAFSGMFNPFNSEVIRLTAYAAAKPFGGRVGPMLFLQRPGTSFFVGRNDAANRRSIPYISSLNLSSMPARGGQTLGNGRFIPGLPLPINFDEDVPGYFWLKNETTPLGGAPQGGDVQFGIPNMVYEYETPFTSTGYSSNTDRLHVITPAATPNDKPIGLFSKSQFAAFKGTRLTGNLTQEMLEDEIARVRAATVYETANYLIPTPNKLNIDNQIDSFGAISGRPRARANGVQSYSVNFFAPLYSTQQDDVLWRTSADVVRTIFDYIRTQETAMTKYRASLNRAAQSIYDMRYNVAAEAGGSIPGYEKAAAGVSDITFSTTQGNAASVMNQKPKSCASLAGQFLEFFAGGQLGSQVENNAGCPESLGNLLNTYFSTVNANYNPNYYKFEYNYLPANLNKGRATPKELSLFSAYVPGPMTGVGNDGLFVNPIEGSNIREKMRRNFYSTKFVPLDSLQKGNPGFDERNSGFPIYSEGRLQQAGSGADTSQSDFKNPLDAASLGIDLSGIKY